jgi:hypothetical protein
MIYILKTGQLITLLMVLTVSVFPSCYTSTITPTAPSVQIDNQNGTVPEQSGPAIVRITVTIPAYGTALTIDYATYDGTALSGSDYTATSGSLVFPAHNNPKKTKTTTQTITIPITNDALAEWNEVFYVSLTSSDPANNPVPSPITITIIDDDCIPINITASNGTNNNEVTANWSAITGADEYIVSRSDTATGTYTEIARSSTNTYDDATAVAGVTYYYKVQSRSLALGTSEMSAYSGGFFSQIIIPGYFNNGTNNAACYWKNGARTTLYEATEASAYHAVSVGTDIYVTGTYHNGTNNVACYWKNGTRTDLYSATEAYACAIYVNGTNVYVSGYYKNGGIDRACYWLNGVIKDLDATYKSQTETILLYGTTVYVAGSYFNGTNWAACYWKDTGTVTKVNLYTASDAYAYSMTISGTGVVYVAGRWDTASTATACLWRDNGTVTKVDLYTLDLAQASGISLYGTTVYVSGDYFNGSIWVPCYWTYNGTTATKFDLTVPDDGFATSIAVSTTGNIYITGGYGTSSNTPCIWINGNIYPFSVSEETNLGYNINIKP